MNTNERSRQDNEDHPTSQQGALFIGRAAVELVGVFHHCAQDEHWDFYETIRCHPWTVPKSCATFCEEFYQK